MLKRPVIARRLEAVRNYGRSGAPAQIKEVAKALLTRVKDLDNMVRMDQELQKEHDWCNKMFMRACKVIYLSDDKLSTFIYSIAKDSENLDTLYIDSIKREDAI